MITVDQAYEARAEVMKALAHPSRLVIADALAEGEMCVCELQELVGSSMPTVSRHLSQMKNAGIVAGRRDGNQIYYRLLVPCVLRLFDCIDAVLQNERERAAQAVEA
ncbi:MAG: metalloregulator ArsR/SmtB family transcription factor [Armatimonadia bacterium]|nr:metalloregulator ArsR/SmtB family transcription factor [Armatimonadia bacterium]